MSLDFRKPEAPSADVRWKIVQATMRKHGFASHSVIETLHKVQEAFGYLDTDALRFVATSLRLPLSRVYGVATFYHFFTLEPQGKHTCVVCMGTACYIKGAADVLASVEHAYDVKPGETTADANLSLLTARCLGACGLAPAVVFDGEVLGKLTPADTLARVAEMESHDA
jgi:bidirectional [NiFe] hydrogenase diaphorase subunit